MSKCVLVKKGSSPPLYYVTLDSDLNADSEEIWPVPPGFDREPPPHDSIGEMVK